jgi:tubulin-specific chaperone D
LNICDWKTVRFFPHEIADLSITLDYMLASGGPCQQSSQWPLRYIVLLWLSLICMIPFDLDQFDEPEHVGKTAGDIASLAQGFLGKAGLERDGAAMLLSRLYIRYGPSLFVAERFAASS